MDLPSHISMLSTHLKEKWGSRVHKVSVNAAFTCPNRDGTKGIGGCTFCNNSSFSPNSTTLASVRDQILAGQAVIRRRTHATRFMAYFQSYTNTYADLETLRALYHQALSVEHVIGLSVGTRPDCVPDAVLDLLAGIRDQGKEVWLELGLQSAFDESLIRVNRGHGFAEYEDAAKRAQKRGLQICTHFIVGLPGECPSHSLDSLDRVLALGTQGVKIHPLHVVKGTQLARQWKQGAYEPISEDQYIETVVAMLRRLPKSVLVHRLTGTASTDLLLAPEWCSKKWRILNAIGEAMQHSQTA